MVTCPNTGYTVPDTSLFCQACGKLNHVPSKRISVGSVRRVSVKQVRLIGGKGTGGAFGG